MISLHRPLLFHNVIKGVLSQGNRYGTNTLGLKAVINRIQSISKTFGEHMTIYQLRSIVLAEHIKLLLVENG